jgi:HK97 family phage portal protein
MGLAATIARRALRPFQRAAEGEYRPGPWLVTNPDGWLPDAWGKYANFWQMGYDPIGGGTSAVVEACVAAYAQTIAMCPGDHWRRTPDGGRERVTSSALSRILRRPNEYQSRSDFILNLVRDLYLEGNTYALAQRNDRFEVSAFHPFNPRVSGPLVASTGDIFYKLAGNNILETPLAKPAGQGFGVVPARDVMHIKLEARNDQPLVGISPLRHAASAVAAQTAIGSSLINFFANMSRPSGIMSTDLNLSKEQVDDMRARWNEQARGLNAGGVPILTNGLKFQGISVSAKDAEMTAALKLTQDEIFMVYGVPPAILGMTDRSAFASTEALMQFWLSRGLGFAINHIEVAFDHFFGLRGWPDEWVEFDTAALLRVAYKDRIEAMVRGVQGGLYAPDEARNLEDLPDVPGGFGEEPRVQQQVVPLSAWAKAPPATPAPEAPPPSPAPATPDGEDDAEKDWVEHMTQRVAAHDREAA